MHGILWELHQQHRIDDANVAAGNAGREVKRLQERLDALVLVNMAMWSLIQDRLGLTEAALADRVRDIDLRDGRLDGGVAPDPVACTACGRTVSARRKRCIYCGTESLTPAPFRGTH
jgi:hypothetical protein